jgi:hypothetical protein
MAIVMIVIGVNEGGKPMGDELRLPRELAEAVIATRFPEATDERMQDLMDRNNDGRLTAEERKELESLVAMSESLSLLRARAYRVLGRIPL